MEKRVVDQFGDDCLEEAAREPRVVPAPVLVELEYLLRVASDTAAFPAFLENCSAGAFTIAALLPEEYVRIGELLERYADLRLGFVDASVLTVAERLREPKLATLDHRHFSIVRPRHVTGAGTAARVTRATG